MDDYEFLGDFKDTFKVKINPVVDKKQEWYGHVFSWKPEIEIIGEPNSEIYELQKMALKESLPLWAEDNTLLLDANGFKEIMRLIKEEWGI